jgi:tetratricopeptide (TPR) repeat protein
MLLMGIALLLVASIFFQFAPTEIANWYLAAALEKKENEGDPEAARQLLAQALSWAPRHAELYRQRAKWELEDNNLVEGLADVRRAINIASESGQPNQHAELYVLRSLEKLKDEDFAGSLAAAKRAVELATQTIQPENRRQHAELCLRKAQQKLEDGDLQGSLDEANQAVELVPESTKPFKFRSYIYFRMKRLAEAVADQSTALEIWEQRSALAVFSADKSIKRNALNERAYLRALGNFDLEEALQDVEQALNLLKLPHEDEATFLDTRGYIHYLQDDLEAASRDMIRAKDLEEESHGITFEQLLLISSGEDEAKTDLAASYGDFAVIYHHYGLVLKKQEQTEQAQQYLDLANQLGYNQDAGVW